MSSIPASELVAVNPSVLGAGGSALDLIGLVLTESTRVPIGTVQGFPDDESVGEFFGSGSSQAALAAIYFAGFDGANKLPGQILFAQYPGAAVSGYLRGGNISGLTLTELQGITPGTLTITFAGSGLTSSSIDLSGATSFSNAATIIAAAFTTPPFAVTYDSVSGAFVFTSTATGVAETIIFPANTIATALLLTAATGAVLSQGADAASPASFMNGVIAVTTNWANFMTDFNPDSGSANTVKQAFAAWKNTQNNRFGYVCWDTDLTPTESVPATGSLGYILAQNGDSGTFLAWEPSDQSLAAFTMGVAASIDFTQAAGRTDFAYREQDGLVAGVTNATVANNLAGNPQSADRGNGYNFYGSYGAANANFTWLQRGFCTGPFAWFDSYENQIAMNNAFQNALLNLQKNSKSIPYTVSGAALIESALADPIATFGNFGAFAPGTISQSQIASVNAAAGIDIATTLQTQGYYVQILQASSTTRAARTSPPCQFWYLDRGSVQAITLASVALQ